VALPKDDRLQIPVLKNKWYFDEIYTFLFVRPAAWFAEKVSYLFLDRKVIDGFLHALARFSLFLGSFFRNAIDRPIINSLIGDGTGSLVRASGGGLRKVQAGRVQYYMAASVAVLVLFALLFLVFARGS
jgi:NADH:ubiquinone oxidoreductase subunit 5 (subunit L)/multisubunit Na+/H+ antiporter MnhA subunit